MPNNPANFSPDPILSHSSSLARTLMGFPDGFGTPLRGLERPQLLLGLCPPIRGRIFAHRHPFLVSVTCCTNGAFPTNSLVSDNVPSKNPKSTIDRLESLFNPSRAVAEEKIDAPTGVPSVGRIIYNKARCSQCETKGLVLCVTCAGSGLYVDSILESQGIIVKVRCLGCGGSGSTLCSHCGGRGHM